MNARLPVAPPEVPEELLRKQPLARYALFNSGDLLVNKGDMTMMLTPEDIRNLDAFMGTFGSKG